MPIYILKDKTYEISPNIEKSHPSLNQRQLKSIANVLSENLGCFMLFGISLEGEPQIILAASSGIEHLALKKFAEDFVNGEAHINLTPLEDD